MASHPPPSHLGVLVNPATRRLACDQCHAQKLRCTKTDDDRECVRCRRLNRACVWSPPLRNGRPARSSRKRAHEMVDSSVASDQDPVDAVLPPPMSMPPAAQDWNLFDIFNMDSPRSIHRDGPFPTLWTPADNVPFTLHDYFPAMNSWPKNVEDESIPNTVPDNAVPPLVSSQSDAHQPNTLYEITENLSKLNISLLGLHQSLNAEPWGKMFASPSSVIATLSACSTDAGHTHESLTRGRYPLVEIFNQTQQSIVTLKLARTYFTSSSSSSSSSSMEQPDDAQESQPAGADLPTALLIATSYARILDLYTTLITQLSHFVHALNELGTSGHLANRPPMQPMIPPLQWGSFQPASYGALQMLMVLQITSVMLREIEHLLGVDVWERQVVAEGMGSTYNSQRRRPRRRRDEASRGDAPIEESRSGLLSFDLIDLVAGDEETRMDGRLGKIDTLRTMIKDVKGQLEKSINC